MKLVANRKQVDNTKGEVFYGVHMYPGISEFVAAPGQTMQLFISDNTIRKMGPTLAGCPIFCVHQKPVGTLDQIRKDSDGTVVESFFNPADGHHWIKFIITSTKALELISRGYGLSNGYDITREGPGGSRNGVPYDLEVLDGEFHHVAIVRDPRYESIILTPAEFKAYNEEKHAELRRVANSKSSKKGNTMKKSGLSIFTRKKVDNSKELENLSVLLPKSNVEKSITELVKIADKAVQNEGQPRFCKGEDIVVVNEDGEDREVTVEELVTMVINAKEDLKDLKDEVDNEDDEDDEEELDEADVENEDDEDEEEEEDDEDEEEEDDVKNKAKVKNKKVAKNSEKPKALSLDKKDKKAENKGKGKKVANSSGLEGKRRARDIRNAHTRGEVEIPVRVIDTPESKLARGASRYG